MWGKFGQRNEMMHHKVVDSPSEFYDLVLNNKIDISQVLRVPGKMMRIVYQDKKPFVTEHGACNVVVALWTTRFNGLFLQANRFI